LIAGQNLDVPQPVTPVALNAPMIRNTDTTAKTYEAVIGLPCATRNVVRMKHPLAIVRQPAIQFAKGSAPITHTFLSEAMLNERVVGSIMQMQKRERSVVNLIIMKHSLDVQPPAMKIALERTTVPLSQQRFIGYTQCVKEE
jgi:hypothetical protein